MVMTERLIYESTCTCGCAQKINWFCVLSDFNVLVRGLSDLGQSLSLKDF